MEAIVQVINRRGLHARAAAKCVTLAERFSATVTVASSDQTVVATSIMGLLMLGAAQGATLTLTANGVDAREALDALAGLFAAGFHEET